MVEKDAETKARHPHWDECRGLAIVLMLCANVVGYVSPPETHPFCLRLSNSLAAPLFITMSGLIGSLKLEQKSYGYFLLRGGMLLATGAGIDVLIWHIFPFTTYDVLYIIGFGLLILPVYARLPGLRLKITVVGLILGVTIGLQKVFAYADYPHEYFLNGRPTSLIAHSTPLWHHPLMDGWFPIFPWIAFVFVGHLLYQGVSEPTKNNPFLMSRIGLVALVFGVMGFIGFPVTEFLASRGNYSELFYPPRLRFVLPALGIVIGLIALEKPFLVLAPFLAPLRVLGRASLAIYILHSAWVEWIIAPLFADPKTGEPIGSPQQAVLTVFAVILSAFLTAWGLGLLRPRLPKHFLWRFYLGS